MLRYCFVALLCLCFSVLLTKQTLLEHGANINSKDAEGKTPLHIAIENQHAGIISLLLSQPGIDLSARDNKGVTPFAAALTARNNKAAQAILEKNPSAAEQVWFKSIHIIKMLLIAMCISKVYGKSYYWELL